MSDHSDSLLETREKGKQPTPSVKKDGRGGRIIAGSYSVNSAGVETVEVTSRAALDAALDRREKHRLASKRSREKKEAMFKQATKKIATLESKVLELQQELQKKEALLLETLMLLLRNRHGMSTNMIGNHTCLGQCPDVKSLHAPQNEPILPQMDLREVDDLLKLVPLEDMNSE